MAITANDFGDCTSEISDPKCFAGKPLISVLMLVYNHGEYLAEAIQSILLQECEHSFELIIGDDASSDASLKIALAFQARYPNIIRVLKTRTNLGMSANYRRVINFARGEFVAWCEGDDYWCSHNKLALQSSILLDDSLVGAVHTDWVQSRLRQGEWKVNWLRTMHRGMPNRLLEGQLLSVFYDPRILRTCTLMLRKEILNGMLSTKIGKAEYRFCDTVSALFATKSWSIAYVPEVTAVYRVSPNSALRSGTAARVNFLKSALRFDADARTLMGPASGYPETYRLEVIIGLCLWACRAADWTSARVALTDMRTYYPPSHLLRVGWKVLIYRFSQLRARVLIGAVREK